MISIWVMLLAPWRTAVPTQSEPVSPPPITTTCLPRASIRFSGGRSMPCSTRFCMPSNSKAKCTPGSSRPGTGRSRGTSAPMARHTASYSPMSPSIGRSFPTAAPVLNTMPSCSIRRMRRSTIFLLNLKFGIPKRSSPPGSSSFSYTVTVYPLRFNRLAAASPAGPLPTTATFRPLRTGATGLT